MDIAGWEQMYRSGERGAESQPTQVLEEFAPQLTPGRAADLACGTGRNALFLAESGWTVTAIDGSQTAIDELCARATGRGLEITARVSDLNGNDFKLSDDAFDLVLIAYYLQRDLYAKIAPSVRRGGTLIAIVHIPDPGQPLTPKRAAPGELRTFFEDWNILHYYEGPSRDPAHKRPVAEIVARRT